MQKAKVPSPKLPVKGFVAKKNEQANSVIRKVEDGASSNQKIPETDTASSSLQVNRKRPNCNEGGEIQNTPVYDQLDNNVDVNNSCKSTKDNTLIQSYLNFENKANLCWLDTSLSLLVHNKTLRCVVENKSNAQIANIIHSYKEAISVLNDLDNEIRISARLASAKDILSKIQESVFQYLKPILKCKEGEPDSAFCSLLNLIAEDKQIKNLFDVHFAWVRKCENCATMRVKNYKKSIITLPNVKTFQPDFPVSVCKCLTCKTEQNMNLRYKTLPQCLIFHFENGAGEGEYKSLDFEIGNRQYKISGIITLEKNRSDSSVDHFVTWVRDTASDSWLECNDLHSDVLSFSAVPPAIKLQDIYIIMYEALDNDGTIPNKSFVINSDLMVDSEDENGSADIPFIDLSDELEDTKKPKMIHELKETLETNNGKESEEISSGAKVMKNILRKKSTSDPDNKEKSNAIEKEITLSIPLNDAKEAAPFTEDNVASIEFKGSKTAKPAVKTLTKMQIPTRASARIRSLRLSPFASTLRSGEMQSAEKPSMTSGKNWNRSSSAKTLFSNNIKRSLIRNKNHCTQKIYETQYDIQSNAIHTYTDEITSAGSEHLPTTSFPAALQLNKIVHPKSILKSPFSISRINSYSVPEISLDEQELPTEKSGSYAVPSRTLEKPVQNDLTPNKESGIEEENSDFILSQYQSKIEKNDTIISHEKKLETKRTKRYRSDWRGERNLSALDVNETGECDENCKCENMELRELVDRVTDYFLANVFAFLHFGELKK